MVSTIEILCVQHLLDVTFYSQQRVIILTAASEMEQVALEVET